MGADADPAVDGARPCLARSLGRCSADSPASRSPPAACSSRAAASAQDEPPDTAPAAATARRASGWSRSRPGATAPPLPDVVFLGTLAGQGLPDRAVPHRPGPGGGHRALLVRRRGRRALRDRHEVPRDRHAVPHRRQPRPGDRRADVEDPRRRAAVRRATRSSAPSETDVECPVLGDPVRTLLPNGSSVDSGVLTPLTDSKRSLLRALLLPLGVALAAMFGLVALRWLLTGIGWGVAFGHRHADRTAARFGPCCAAAPAPVSPSRSTFLHLDRRLWHPI